MSTDAFQQLDWLFFDVGYTLFDETPAWQDRFEAVSQHLAARGRVVPVDAIWQTYRDVCREFAPLQWFGVCRRLTETDELARELAGLSGGWQHALEFAYFGTAELLASLSSQYKIGVIANQSAGTAQRLEERGLLQYINLVVGSAEAGVRKPDPKIFELALMKAGCSPAAAAMVGDRIDNDIAPARALGMRAIHVRQGGSALQVPRSALETPTASVGGITEIAPLLIR